ncbi:T9SS type A sorting domain-containing protein [Hymenobacter sp. NBH84]|uniref:T9SS type A sorting domain-containing protein n=1 Tax=Hymenobacter sp. NBH84 TaxID=2596915 RepID=UPI0016232FFE|nr:T9SS type A sorting domain-containing protein [Hymenobacter sp. NBH84]QNE40893.1 T9SS type A sorting domain-containing protein [Hymenobacter sp. NBH84]
MKTSITLCLLWLILLSASALHAQNISLLATGPTTVATGGTVPLAVQRAGLNTTLRGDFPNSFPNQGPITLGAPAGVDFLFNAPAPTGDPFPANMLVYLRGQQLASVDFTAPYLNQACALTYRDTTYFFIFLNTDVELRPLPRQTIQFYRNGEPIAGAIKDTYAATLSGTYTARVTSGALAQQVSNEVQVVIGTPLPVGQATPATAIQVYPNPCVDEVQLTGITSGAEVSVYDGLGRLVLQQPAQRRVSLQGLVSGVYMLRVAQDASVRQVRIVKQ